MMMFLCSALSVLLQGKFPVKDNKISLRPAVSFFLKLRQLEMQLEQEYEEKQMVIHEKHDLEGLIATLCDQVRASHAADHVYCGLMTNMSLLHNKNMQLES